MGGKLHLKLNISSSPIANKYREGKLQSTLKRESKVPETAIVEGVVGSPAFKRILISSIGSCSGGLI